MIKVLKKFKITILVALCFIALVIWLPDMAKKSSLITLDYFKEMIIIMPPVFILMGLMESWVPKDKIKKWLGDKSGIKGMAISFLLGTLPTGPLYVAFPIAGSLLKRGARVHNMVIFLGSWAALKIPQLMVEVEFLGIGFTLLRFVLTVTALVLEGALMEVLIKKKSDKIKKSAA
ncbi:MAG: permease [Clostridiales bacterium]|nr:permease [Clostridiales bacterium]